MKLKRDPSNLNKFAGGGKIGRARVDTGEKNPCQVEAELSNRFLFMIAALLSFLEV